MNIKNLYAHKINLYPQMNIETNIKLEDYSITNINRHQYTRTTNKT